MNLENDTVLTRQCLDGSSHWSPVLRWQAVPASYQEGDPIGWGETEQEAVDDLLCKIQDMIDYIVWANPQSHLL